MGRLAAVLACCAALTACSAGPTQSSARDPLKFISVDARRTVTVVETRVPERLTFAQFARNEPKMLVRALRARQVRVAESKVGGRRVLLVTYSLRRKRVEQYFVRTGELMYVVTYTYR
jgi:hypothetical protein